MGRVSASVVDGWVVVGTAVVGGSVGRVEAAVVDCVGASVTFSVFGEEPDLNTRKAATSKTAQRTRAMMFFLFIAFSSAVLSSSSSMRKSAPHRLQNTATLGFFVLQWGHSFVFMAIPFFP